MFLFFSIPFLEKTSTAAPWEEEWPPLPCWLCFTGSIPPSTHCGTYGTLAGTLMQDIRSTSCRKLNYSTGMEDINPGTFLVFTMTYGKAGLFLTLQGSLNCITIDETLQQLKYTLDKNGTGPLYLLTLFFKSNSSDIYDLWCKRQILLCTSWTKAHTDT